MATKMQDVLEEARQLSPLEQIRLIRALSESLPEQYRERVEQPQPSNQDAIPSSVKRTKPATDLREYTADFWTDDETVDELNDFVRQQRAKDRSSDQ